MYIQNLKIEMEKLYLLFRHDKSLSVREQEHYSA